MSTFDPEQFLNEEVEGAIDTKVIPIPEGDWQAQVFKITGHKKQSLESGDVYHILEVLWEILDDAVKEVTEMERPFCKQSVFLDLTEEGSLDMSKGKNRQLGLLREAVGQNKEGKVWGFNNLVGSTATIKVENTPDPNDPENVFSKVKKVTTL